MPTTELSPANQDYLKVIWSAQEWFDRPVTTSLLAQRMNYSASTISEAVKRLTDQGLLTHARYGSIELTESGRAAAVKMVRRHRIIETFLVQDLGYGWDEVHDEAEVLEHAVSEKLIDALEARLGNPTRDPHGDPIPTSSGDVPNPSARQFSKVGTGESVTVTRISDNFPDMLRYFTDVGIGLDTKLTVMERKDFAGTLTVRIGDSGQSIEMGIPAADAIWVDVG